MAKKLSLLAVFLLVWTGIRLAAAERVDQPVYVLMAGKEIIRQQWNHCSRFDKSPNPTLLGRTANYLNDTFFSISKPVFWLENKILGHKINKNDPAYNQLTRYLELISVSNWDYIIFPNKDGSKAMVVKNRSIIQEFK